VFAAGLALMIISYNNFPQRTLEQKYRLCCAALQETFRPNFRANALGAAAR
jgi:hypothetical protein